jgi:hypothetical protein
MTTRSEHIRERNRLGIAVAVVLVALGLGAIILVVGDADSEPADEAESSTTAPTVAPIPPAPDRRPVPRDGRDDEPLIHPMDVVASGFDTEEWVNYPDWGWDGVENGEEPYPAFRKRCHFSHLDDVDPILAPGDDQFGHLHMFFGNETVDENSTYASLRTAGMGTCRGGPLNRTAYWMPTVHDDSGDVVVPNWEDGGFELYYKGESARDHHPEGSQVVQPYPPGLQFIAGQTVGHVGGDLSESTWGWRCANGPRTTAIPHCPVGLRLRAEIKFPQCWDGVHLWLPKNAHMDWGVTPDGVSSAWYSCHDNETHPIHLPELTIFADWKIQPDWDTSTWYLSSDRRGPNPDDWAANGSTLHADWLMAWDQPTLERWIDGCLRPPMRSSGGGVFCEGDAPQTTGGQMVAAPITYSGPWTISGWSPQREITSPVS